MIDCLAVMTRDRPNQLRHCLESHIENLRTHGRKCDIIVMDDAFISSDYVLLGLDLPEGVTVKHFGIDERLAYLAELTRRVDVPEETLRFALFGGPSARYTLGAQRNALLLLTLGRQVACVDDDVICRLSDRTSQNGVTYSYAPEHHFFESRQDAFDAAPATDVDILGVHEQLLSGDHGDVKVTMLGVVGDPGTRGPHGYLQLENESRERLTESEEAYRKAITSRNVIRSVTQRTVSSSPFLMGYAMALDNDGLPPFFPEERNSDGIFAETLRRSDPGALIGHLPYAIFHDAEPREWKEDDVWTTWATWRASDIVLAVLSVVGRGWSPLWKMGEDIKQTALNPCDIVRAQRKADMKRREEALRGLLVRYNHRPGFWARDVERSIDVLSRAVRERIMTPDEWASGTDGGERMTACLESFGDLMVHWDAICSAARTVNEEHAFL